MLTLILDNDSFRVTKKRNLNWKRLAVNGIRVATPTSLLPDLSNACTLCLPPSLTEQILAVPFYLQLDEKVLQCDNCPTHALEKAAAVMQDMGASDTCARTTSDYDDENSSNSDDDDTSSVMSDQSDAACEDSESEFSDYTDS